MDTITVSRIQIVIEDVNIHYMYLVRITGALDMMLGSINLAKTFVHNTFNKYSDKVIVPVANTSQRNGFLTFGN